MMTERTSRPQRARIAAPLGGRRHPVHVAVRAFGEELLEPLLSPRRSASGRVTPTTSKPLRARLLDQRGLDLGGIVQKSRSA